MTYLFLFTIGPVQSFIAQARKTQDLYAGSQILSDLIHYAMSWATSTWENHSSVEIIYPYFDGTTVNSSYPNRFVAKYTGDNIANFGEALNDEVHRFFREDIVLSSIGSTYYAVCEHQITDFLETYWAAVLLTEDYSKSMTNLEKELAAIKNYRCFKQLPQSETGRKCSLNGFYNALYYRKTDKDSTDVVTRKYLDANCQLFEPTDTAAVSLMQLQHGEGLCGISFVKRFYKATPSFKSTANIALMATLEALKNAKELNAFLRHFGKNLDTINGQLFFSENLNKDYLKSQGERFSENFIRTAIDLLRGIEKLAASKNLKLHKYYAVLVFDADNMGKQIEACTSKEIHNQLSEKLSSYASWAKDFVDSKNYGRSIYAGGDDFLGMLTLPTLFTTLTALREKFATDFADENLTFSAGVCIAHYKTPLGEVLKYTRAMEKKAKKHRTSKDCLGIAVLKHSGEIHETVLPWKADTHWITEYLADITDDLKNKFSAKFIKTLNEEVAIWEANASDRNFLNVTKSEIKRLIIRQDKGMGGSATELACKVSMIYDQTSAISNATEYFINALNVCDFINRKF